MISQTYEFRLKTFWWLVFREFFLTLLFFVLNFFVVLECLVDSILNSQAQQAKRLPIKAGGSCFENSTTTITFFDENVHPLLSLFLGYLPLFLITLPVFFIPDFKEPSSISINHLLKQKCCKKSFVMLCAIWYHLSNLKNVKTTLGGVLFLK